MTDQTKEREAFEKALRAEGFDSDHFFEPMALGAGDYYNDDTQMRWEGWKLAQSLAPAWIDCKQQLPESGKRVIFAWVNTLGNFRTSMGYYAAKHTLEAPGEWDADYCDSVNDGAIYFIPEGWYEEGHEIEECASIRGVTHWQPLPAPPCHQPQEPTPPTPEKEKSAQ